MEHADEVNVELTPIEARVLGVLIEKSFLTPDSYPLTTNALVTGCNQKSSRDPVVAYTAIEVDAVLLELRQRKLVRRVHTQGARSTKHRHALDEALSLTDQQVALLSVLLLRGDQTVGELRTRTDRHAVFAEAVQVNQCLEAMAAAPRPLVVELARQPGHKETRWRHLLGTDTEAVPAAAPGAVPASPPAAPVPAAAVAEPAAPSAPSAPSMSPQVRSSSAPPSFAERVATLEAQVKALTERLDSLEGVESEQSHESASEGDVT